MSEPIVDPVESTSHSNDVISSESSIFGDSGTIKPSGKSIVHNGETWNEETHLPLNPDGSPQLNVRNKLKRRRGGRKGIKRERAIDPDDKDEEESKHFTGETFCNALERIMNGWTESDDWSFELKKDDSGKVIYDEKKSVSESSDDYIKSLSIKAPSPGWVFLGVMSLYALPRLVQSDKTKAAISNFYHSIKSTFWSQSENHNIEAESPGATAPGSVSNVKQQTEK